MGQQASRANSTPTTTVPPSSVSIPRIVREDYESNNSQFNDQDHHHHYNSLDTQSNNILSLSRQNSFKGSLRGSLRHRRRRSSTNNSSSSQQPPTRRPRYEHSFIPRRLSQSVRAILSGGSSSDLRDTEESRSYQNGLYTLETQNSGATGEHSERSDLSESDGESSMVSSDSLQIEGIPSESLSSITNDREEDYESGYIYQPPPSVQPIGHDSTPEITDNILSQPLETERSNLLHEITTFATDVLRQSRVGAATGLGQTDDQTNAPTASTASPSSSTNSSINRTSSRLTGTSRVPVSQNSDSPQDLQMSFDHQAQMLSRLLEIAAISTVLTLLGSTRIPGRRFDNSGLNNASTSVVDNTFAEFLEGLRGRLLVDELRRNDSNDRSMSFFRAFRFDSPTNMSTTEDFTALGGEEEDDDDDDATSDVDRQTMEDIQNFNITTEDEDGNGELVGLNAVRDSLSSGSLDYRSYRSPNISTNRNHRLPRRSSRNTSRSTSQVPVMIIGVRSVTSSESSTGDFGDEENDSGEGYFSSDSERLHSASTNSNEAPIPVRDSNGDFGSRSTHTESNSHRSWVIFVMGNSFTSTHPVLTAPTLLSDSPTYEDLLNLQELIGDVKPPVVSRDELNKHDDEIYTAIVSDSPAGKNGVFVNDSECFNTKTLKVLSTDRCQICLSEYQPSESIRQLSQCKHCYHKLCIDEWLLVGRNSCPLCRSKAILTSSAGVVD